MRYIELTPTNGQPNELLSLHAIAHYKLANAVPFDKEVSYSQIAATTGLNEADAKRVLRHAMAKHFSHEPRKGFVVHTAPSKHLAEDAQLADWVGVSTELWETAAHTINAMEKFPGSQEPHETVSSSLSHSRTRLVARRWNMRDCTDSVDSGLRIGEQHETVSL